MCKIWTGVYRYAKFPRTCCFYKKNKKNIMSEGSVEEKSEKKNFI